VRTPRLRSQFRFFIVASLAFLAEPTVAPDEGSAQGAQILMKTR
jgi:hypothetical protein